MPEIKTCRACVWHHRASRRDVDQGHGMRILRDFTDASSDLCLCSGVVIDNLIAINGHGVSGLLPGDRTTF
tara:strand:+ start:325 stop:537 length:213 start_codon:yes stop_codon:yes gene_type:complete